MFASLLMLLLTQQPATAGETLLECLCERETREERAVLDVMEWFAPRAKTEEEASQKADSVAEAAVAPDCSEPKDCKGQLHHIISNPIANALEIHRTLRGLYKARGPALRHPGRG
jgi:hypothetical protein